MEDGPESDGNICMIITYNKPVSYTHLQENWLVEGHGKKRADQCIKCGKCEEACPQHIKSRQNLEIVTKELL